MTAADLFEEALDEPGAVEVLDSARAYLEALGPTCPKTEEAARLPACERCEEVKTCTPAMLKPRAREH